MSSLADVLLICKANLFWKKKLFVDVNTWFVLSKIYYARIPKKKSRTEPLSGNDKLRRYLKLKGSISKKSFLVVTEVFSVQSSLCISVSAFSQMSKYLISNSNKIIKNWESKQVLQIPLAWGFPRIRITQWCAHVWCGAACLWLRLPLQSKEVGAGCSD